MLTHDQMYNTGIQGFLEQGLWSQGVLGNPTSDPSLEMARTLTKQQPELSVWPNMVVIVLLLQDTGNSTVAGPRPI